MPSGPHLDNHLCNSLSAECLTAHELLLLQSRQRIAKSCQSQNNSCRDQAAGIDYEAEPLNHRHDPVDCCSHVVRGESANKGIELGRGRADPEEKGDLDEYEDK